MATNVIVVDVINEDKIVTLEELRYLKRVPSRDSCSSRHSNVQTPISQITPVNSVHEISCSIRTSKEFISKEAGKEALGIRNTVETKEMSLVVLQKDAGTSETLKKISSQNTLETNDITDRKTKVLEGKVAFKKGEEVAKDNAEEVDSLMKKVVQLDNVKNIVDDVPMEITLDDIDGVFSGIIRKELAMAATMRVDKSPENRLAEDSTVLSVDKINSPSPSREDETPLINSLSEESYNKDDEEEFLLARSNTTESEATVIDNHLLQCSQEEQRSSGSEHEIDAKPHKESSVEDDTERKSLFQQNDSVDEELPYVPTTLPLER